MISDLSGISSCCGKNKVAIDALKSLFVNLSIRKDFRHNCIIYSDNRDILFLKFFCVSFIVILLEKITLFYSAG